MKKISSLIVITLALHITNVNADTNDKTLLHSDDCKGSLFSYTREFILQVLKDGGPENAEKNLGVPISTIYDWTDKEIGETLRDITKKEPTKEQIPIIDLSYWNVMNQTENDAMEIQRVHATIEITAEKLGVSRVILFAWISNREVQLSFLYTIAQRKEGGTLSDWIHEYKNEFDKLQSLSQHTMSLLHRDGRYNTVALALENGVEKTAQDLDIPYSILSLLVFRYTINTEIIRRRMPYPLQIAEDFVREARMMINNNMTVAEAARDLGMSTSTLFHLLQKYKQQDI